MYPMSPDVGQLTLQGARLDQVKGAVEDVPPSWSGLTADLTYVG